MFFSTILYMAFFFFLKDSIVDLNLSNKYDLLNKNNQPLSW